MPYAPGVEGVLEDRLGRRVGEEPAFGLVLAEAVPVAGVSLIRTRDGAQKFPWHLDSLGCWQEST